MKQRIFLLHQKIEAQAERLSLSLRAVSVPVDLREDLSLEFTQFHGIVLDNPVFLGTAHYRPNKECPVCAAVLNPRSKHRACDFCGLLACSRCVRKKRAHPDSAFVGEIQSFHPICAACQEHYLYLTTYQQLIVKEYALRKVFKKVQAEKSEALTAFKKAQEGRSAIERLAAESQPLKALVVRKKGLSDKLRKHQLDENGVRQQIRSKEKQKKFLEQQIQRMRSELRSKEEQAKQRQKLKQEEEGRKEQERRRQYQDYLSRKIEEKLKQKEANEVAKTLKRESFVIEDKLLRQLSEPAAQQLFQEQMEGERAKMSGAGGEEEDKLIFREGEGEEPESELLNGSVSGSEVTGPGRNYGCCVLF